MRGWASLGRPVAEFWTLSPAQVLAIFDSNDMLAKRGSAKDFLAAVGASGISADIQVVRDGGS